MEIRITVTKSEVKKLESIFTNMDIAHKTYTSTSKNKSVSRIYVETTMDNLVMILNGDL